VSVEVADAKRCEERLRLRGIRVAERSGFLRVTPHFYNTENEIDRFIDALRSECADVGMR
jgi:selenocysteine lyase/cysteine desulfurase